MVNDLISRQTLLQAEQKHAEFLSSSYDNDFDKMSLEDKVRYDMHQTFISDILNAESMGTTSLDAIRALETQIKAVKQAIRSTDTDYLIGYISALSAVEGMISEMIGGTENENNK